MLVHGLPLALHLDLHRRVVVAAMKRVRAGEHERERVRNAGYGC